MRQFYLKPGPGGPLGPGDRCQLDAEESHHLRTVLRGGRDLVLNLTDGLGRRYTAQVHPDSPGQTTVEILDFTEDTPEMQRPQLGLAVAVVKGRRFDWALEKAVELGAHRIIPLQTERGVIEPGEGKQARWRGILRSAMKQCARSWLPELDQPVDLKTVLGTLSGPAWFGASPGEWPSPEKRVAVPCKYPGDDPAPQFLWVFVGPEGGWSPGEVSALLDSGTRPLACGPHVLRTETAAAAGLVVLQQWRIGLIGGQPPVCGDT